MQACTELWQVSRVAAHLAITKRRVYTLIEEGKLETVRLGPRGVRVLRRSVDAYVLEQVRLERWRRATGDGN
ncbi:excisionase family DNA-binding protein [Candidatus Sumerlaeota bacterium]|nr:excisionase family DNA-binding protein [Candidatus Sumerlaeota bacterium]